MTRLLVSVRSVAEALTAARGGADFIDLKEPGRGALGDLPVATIRAIVAALREAGIEAPVSATIGDVAMSALDEIARRVDAVAACGVDIVKVGIDADDPAATAVLHWLAGCGHTIVPVFIAERGLPAETVHAAARLGFRALMVDTADKTGGSLFEQLDDAALRAFIDAVHDAGAEAGIAGALRSEQAARIAALAPDFAGFRSAVCAGARSDALDPARLHALVDAMRRAFSVRSPAARRSAARASAPARSCARGRSGTRRHVRVPRSCRRARPHRRAARA